MARPEVSYLLLDTCALIFLSDNNLKTDVARVALRNAYESGDPVYVSPISAWEIGLLVSLGRLNLSLSPENWFASLRRKAGLTLTNLSPDVLIASSFLPDAPCRDPADRIMAATAREYGFILVTRDTKLLAYAEKGHIRALPC